MVTKAEFLFMIHLVHIPSHLVHTATNIQCTLQLYYPVHTAANLQCIHTAAVITSSVHTAATLSGSNTIQYIQCTFEPPQGKPIPLLAYLQDSQHTLMVDYSSPCDEEDWLIIAVQDVNE